MACCGAMVGQIEAQPVVQAEGAASLISAGAKVEGERLVQLPLPQGCIIVAEVEEEEGGERANPGSPEKQGHSGQPVAGPEQQHKGHQRCGALPAARCCMKSGLARVRMMNGLRAA